MMMSRSLWKTEKSSIVRRTELVLMIHHGLSVVVSSTEADQTQRTFFCILPVWLVELPGRRVLQNGSDIGCLLLRRERTSQPDMMGLLDGGTCRSANWPCTPPAAEVLANVNDAERQQWYDQTSVCATQQLIMSRPSQLTFPTAPCEGWWTLLVPLISRIGYSYTAVWWLSCIVIFHPRATFSCCVRRLLLRLNLILVSACTL